MQGIHFRAFLKFSACLARHSSGTVRYLKKLGFHWNPLQFLLFRAAGFFFRAVPETPQFFIPGSWLFQPTPLPFPVMSPLAAPVAQPQIPTVFLIPGSLFFTGQFIFPESPQFFIPGSWADSLFSFSDLLLYYFSGLGFRALLQSTTFEPRKECVARASTLWAPAAGLGVAYLGCVVKRIKAARQPLQQRIAPRDTLL